MIASGESAPRIQMRESGALALGIWVLLHAAALAMVSADYRITANVGARQIALPLAVCTGIAAASLLMGGLLRSNALTLIAGAVAFLTIQFAALICGMAGTGRPWLCTAKVLAWLAALRLLEVSLRAKWPIAAPAFVAMYVIGTALLWYCFSEFGARRQATSTLEYASPLLVIGTWLFWVHAGVVCAVAAFVWLSTRTQKSSAPQMPT